jgi:flagellar hook assembly protein FlgD
VARVEIFDLRGRRVRLLSDEALDAGENRWIWDGEDDAGHALASGSYFVRARSQSETLVRRAVLVR